MKRTERVQSRSDDCLLPQTELLPGTVTKQSSHQEKVVEVICQDLPKPASSQNCSFNFEPMPKEKQQRAALVDHSTYTFDKVQTATVATHAINQSIANYKPENVDQGLADHEVETTTRAKTDTREAAFHGCSLDGLHTTHCQATQGLFEDGPPQVVPDRSNIEVADGTAMSRTPRGQRPPTPCIPSITPKGPKLFRVGKPQTRARAKVFPKIGYQFPVPVSVVNEPSAEELLFLVMRRTRMKEQAEQHLLDRQQELEAHNEELQRKSQTHKESLDAALARELEHKSILHSHQAELGAYKARFEKIKAWAKSMSKSYEDLQRQSCEMKDSQRLLSTAKDEINNQIQLLQTSSAKTSESLMSLKSKVCKVRKAVEPLEQAVLTAEKRLDEKDNQLREARAQNVRFETHIAELSIVQNKYNKAVTREQHDNVRRLKKVEEVLEKIRTDINVNPKQPPGADQCLTLLEALKNWQKVGPDDLEQLHNALAGISEK
jgi:hypothetical protein